MDAERLKEMRSVDVRAVDPATLVDIREVNIDPALPKEQRMRAFARQVKNPYCYRVGKVAVKVSFAATGATLEDRLESLLMKL